MKYVKKTLLAVVILFAVFWGASILKCEILTACYGEYFEENYKSNTMMGEIDYLKVLDYSGNTARVYYVSKNRACGDILVFEKRNGQWVYGGWEKTVWSKTGSAEGYMWPYLR